MPIYEYRCTACGHSVEVVHPISGSGPETCAVCGGVMKKALTTPAIHFKGSGWAKKDARSSAASGPSTAGAASNDGAGGDGKSSSDGGSEAGGKSDTTPAPAASESSTSATSDSGSSATGTASTPGKARAGSIADRSA